MDYDGLGAAGGMGTSHPPQEVEERGGVAGNAKVRPGDEMELAELLGLFRVGLWISQEGKRVKAMLSVS